MSEKEQFLGVWEQEYPTTLKVLKAYPATKSDLRPHERARTAKELAWAFVFEGTAGAQAVAGTLELPPKGIPAPPEKWDDVAPACERAFRALSDAVRKAPDAELNKTVKFFTGPKQMGDMRKLDLLWFMLMDMVHHRGQLSVYLRMAGGKVPSIYGPSADEPWM
jgi:uncharacterized damage-inducible protein DinB